MINRFKKYNRIEIYSQKKVFNPMNYFLIDYENLASHGLKGITNLTSDDIVHIFYTSASDCLSFEIHQELIKSKAKIIYQKVDNGVKNALDFQLSSFLGYLIKSNGIGDFNYYIVSKDKGYTALVKYWKKRNIKVSIVIDLNKTSIEFDDIPTHHDSNSIKSLIPEDAAADIKQKLKKVLKNDKDIALVLQYIDKYKTKQHVHNALEKAFPSKDNQLGRNIYWIIKPYINN